MLFKIILNYLIGYVNIEIEGYYIERFINTCMQKNILLWGIKRTKSSIMYAKVGASDFKSACKIAKKHQCKIKINGKRGMPFVAKRYRRRKIFIVLLILVIAIIFAISRFIWNVEVTGNSKISSEEILQIAKEDGLKNGILKNKINTENIINKIRMNREDIAWIGIDIKGTNAIIKIVEADAKPDIIDENDFCNITAKKDGVICKISAQNGTIMVKEGDSVKKGDVLISGWMEGKYTGRYYVNSNGEVMAKINYSQTEKIDKKETKRDKTGKTNIKYAIKFNNFKINFYKRLSKFENYDTIESSKNVKIFSNFYLPIEFIKYTNYEVNESEISNDKDEAKNIGEHIAVEKLDNLINGEVSKKSTDIAEYDSYYNVTVNYEVIENIGTKEKIEF